MCKTKLRSFLNNQVKSFETLKEKHSLSIFLSLLHTFLKPVSKITKMKKKRVQAFKLYKINSKFIWSIRNSVDAKRGMHRV